MQTLCHRFICENHQAHISVAVGEVLGLAVDVGSTMPTLAFAPSFELVRKNLAKRIRGQPPRMQ